MKKSLFLLALPLIALAACDVESGAVESGDDLPKGGTEISLEGSEGTEELSTQLAKTIKNSATAIGEGFGVSGNVSVSASTKTEATSAEGATDNEITIKGLGCGFDFAVSKLSGKNLSDVDAAFNITGLAAEQVKIQTEEFSLDTAIASSSISAYLDNCTIYADLSNPVVSGLITNVMTGIFEQSMGTVDMSGYPEEIISQYQAQMSQYIDMYISGIFGDFKLNFGTIEDTQIPDFAATFADEVELAQYIAQQTAAETEVKVADVLTAKKYDDGSFGVQFDLTFDKLKGMLGITSETEVSVGEGVTVDFEGLESFDIKASVLTDTDLKLASVGVEFGVSGEVGEGSTLSISVAANAEFNYNATVTLPSDLASYHEPSLDFGA